MNERWKYTDVAALNLPSLAMREASEMTPAQIAPHCLADAITLVLVNGRFEAALSAVSELPVGVIAMSMQAARKDYPLLVRQFARPEVSAVDFPYASANLAKEQDGLFFYVPENTKLTRPVHLMVLAHGAEAARADTQHLFIFASRSHTTILQEYSSESTAAYFNNTVTLMNLHADSHVQLIKHQRENHHATHMENLFVRQAENSHLSVTHISNGAQFARDDVMVELQAQGAVCQTSGFYHTRRDGQYVDHHIDIQHLDKNTQSEMLYKGIIDKKSKAVFNGRLCVAPEAQKIQAVQGNHHLLLSPFAEAYSKPELEIYADDVKCRHGATTGQIDQDALFYLRARGIDRDSAVALLLKGFAQDVLQRIEQPAIQQHISRQVRFDA